MSRVFNMFTVLTIKTVANCTTKNRPQPSSLTKVCFKSIAENRNQRTMLQLTTHWLPEPMPVGARLIQQGSE